LVEIFQVGTIHILYHIHFTELDNLCYFRIHYDYVTYMNIVMVAPFAYSVKGTVRARMAPIAEELVLRGHSVHIVIPPWDNPQEGGKTQQNNGVMYYHIDIKEDSPIEHLKLIWRTIKKVQSLSPDLIHAYKPIGESGMAAAYFTLFSKCPVVIDTDDWEGDGGQNKRSQRSRLVQILLHLQEKFIPRLVDSVTIASRTLETQMWGYKVPPEQTFYVPNGQASDRININGADSNIVRQTLKIGDAPIVLLYTRFFEYDLKRAVDLFVRIKDQHPNTEFIVVGKGKDGEHDEFAAEIETRNLADSTHMMGWVVFKELPNYFAAADVAVYPFADTLINRSKCPAKLTELMLAGIPVVGEDVGQISEYIEHDVSGLLVPSGDQQTFADSVAALLADDTKRESIGKSARDRILTEFSWSSVTDSVEQAYKYVTN